MSRHDIHCLLLSAACTDLGPRQGGALAALGPLSSETVLLLFTMVDRHDAGSRWAPFWLSLAPARTGAPRCHGSCTAAAKGPCTPCSDMLRGVLAEQRQARYLLPGTMRTSVPGHRQAAKMSECAHACIKKRLSSHHPATHRLPSRAPALTAPREELAVLKGTPAHAQALAARQVHLGALLFSCCDACAMHAPLAVMAFETAQSVYDEPHARCTGPACLT